MDLSPAGRRAWDAVVAEPARALVCTDFDGVLSPIVADPDQAWASPEAVAALARLAARVAKVAVVTGRPARKAVELGRLGTWPGPAGVSVLGLYGLERWDSDTGALVEPPAPPGVDAAAAELPTLLAALGLGDARVEHKRLSVGVHTRELPDPAGAYERLREPVAALAERHGLHLEPGRLVLELRAAGTDKGDAMRRLVDEVRPRAVVYAGDDLGDLPAFDAVRRLRAEGRVEGLLVCSASPEQDALVDVADVVVDGPAGVTALLERLAADLGA